MRDELADILNAAERPPASALGSEVIRFSSRPELGGRAAVIEIVGSANGRAAVRLYILSGHPRTGWELMGAERFMLPAQEYRRLAADVDAAIARYREPVPNPENGEMIICMDGPGFLTERIRDGRQVTMVGQCPPEIEAEHPNREIAGFMVGTLCRHVGLSVRVAPFTNRRCPRH